MRVTEISLNACSASAPTVSGAASAAAAAATLDHPFIARSFYHEVVQPGGQPAACCKLRLVSELCNAGSLRGALEAGMLSCQVQGSWQRRTRVLQHVVEALEYVHSRGLSHGALCPSSVLLSVCCFSHTRHSRAEPLRAEAA